MEKTFLDELIEALLQLKEQKKEAKLPVPPTPHEVLKTVAKVAKSHNITAEELSSFLGLRGVSPADLQAVQDLKNSRN